MWQGYEKLVENSGITGREIKKKDSQKKKESDQKNIKQATKQNGGVKRAIVMRDHMLHSAVHGEDFRTPSHADSFRIVV